MIASGPRFVSGGRVLLVLAALGLRRLALNSAEPRRTVGRHPVARPNTLDSWSRSTPSDSRARATPPKLARVHVSCWEQAYSAFLPPSYWDDNALTQRTRMWENVISTPARRDRTLVAESAAGVVVGFAGRGRPRDDDLDIHIELYMIYLLAEHHGTGVAAAMLTQLLGENPASLWVFKENPRARAFYAKHGFVPDGAEKDLADESGDESLRGIAEIRMVRR